MRRRWVTVTSLVAVFAAASVAYTWPLPVELRSVYVYQVFPTVLGYADSYLTSWMLAWGVHALWTQPLSVFDANIFHPIRGALAFSEHMLGAAVTIAPVDVVWRDPVLDHNVLLLMSYVLTGVGTALLLLEVGTSMPAAVVGGALATFGPFRLFYLGHVHLMAHHWMPFTWLFLLRLLRTGRWGAGVGFALCLLLQATTAVYHAYYFGLAVAVFLALHLACGLPAARGAYLRALLLCACVAVALIPTFLPYRELATRFGLARSQYDVLWFSAVGDNFLGAFLAPLRWLHDRFTVGADPPMGAIGWGNGLLVLAAVAIGMGRGRGGRRPAVFYLGLALVMGLVSLGPLMRMHPGFVAAVPGPYALLRVVPGWDALRAPARASISSFLAFAVLAGLGAESLLSLGGRARVRVAVLALLAGVVVFDCWRRPLFVWRPPISAGARAAHEWVATHARGVPVVELPFGHPEYEGEYMVLSSRHWNPLLNGRSGFDPAGPYLRALLATFPSPDSLGLLHDVGVGVAIVHDDLSLVPVCPQASTQWSPYVAYVPIDSKTCVLRLLGAPAPPPVPPDRPIPMATVRLTGSDGASAAAAADGDLATHWTQEVVGGVEGWLQIDLPEARVVRRMRLRFGPHFGDYLRQYRLDASADGTEWTTAVPTRLGEPPLRSLARDREDLVVDISVPPTSTAHLRLVRPKETTETPYGVFAAWHHWGVHEIALYEAAGS